MAGARPRQRLTAVVAAATTWEQFPRLWKELLDEVHATVEAPGLNVMVYLDDVPNVEVGVLVDAPIEPTGRVINSQLPEGPTVSVVHRGPYDQLRQAHDAIHRGGHDLAGPRWEIYGHHSDDPETEVVYLLR